MGCTQSGGASSSQSKTRRYGQSIQFKRTGAHSVDRFFDEVKDLLNKFDDISEPVEDAVANFYDQTLFYEVPCAKMKHVFSGIIMSLSSMSGGDMSQLNVSLKTSKPFFTANTKGFKGDLVKYGDNLVEAVQKMMEALSDVVGEKMEGILRQAEEVGDKVQWVQDSGKSEIEAMNVMEKAKATAAMALNVKELPKVPTLIKECYQKYKDLLIEMKEAVEEVNGHMPKLGEDGKKCAAIPKYMPTECYVQINGPIKYNQAERTKWEKNMRGWHKNHWFEPSNIHKKDMVN